MPNEFLARKSLRGPHRQGDTLASNALELSRSISAEAAAEAAFICSLPAGSGRNAHRAPEALLGIIFHVPETKRRGRKKRTRGRFIIIII